MEFHETLQALRKQRAMTQEELAGALFVSRTAVSKWESGRGYPNIDSLKAIAGFFGVTVDALLSGDAPLSAAETDTRRREGRLRDLVFGLLDCSAALFLFLPFFVQRAGGALQAGSLLSLPAMAPYLRAGYFTAVAAMVLTGILTLALQGRFRKLSLALGGAGTLLCIISLQPYAATLLLASLAVKMLMLIRWA